MIKKELHIAIRQAVDMLGDEVVMNPHLHNILADFHAYESHSKESDAERKAIQIAVDSGYGERLIQWKQGNIGESEVNSFLEDIIAKDKLDAKVINKVAKAMQSALGLFKINAFSEISNLQETSELIKSEYEEQLQKLLTITEDCIGLKTAYYTPEAITQLFKLEGESFIISRALNQQLKWSEFVNKRNHLCQSKSDSDSHREQVAKNVLKTDGEEYKKIVSDSLPCPNPDLDVSDIVFSKETVDKIKLLATRLNRAHTILKDGCVVDADNDMQSAIEDATRSLQKYIYDRKKQLRKRQLIITISISAIVLFIVLGGVDRIKYNKNKQHIQTFLSTIDEGEKMYAEHHFEEALTLYEKAADNYTCGYRTSHYKGIAEEKANKVSTLFAANLQYEIQRSLKNGDLAKASELLRNIPNNLRFKSSQQVVFEYDMENYRAQLRSKITTRRDLLLSRLSTQKGKCSSTNIKELEYLLECLPDDYYLNMIKDKMK